VAFPFTCTATITVAITSTITVTSTSSATDRNQDQGQPLVGDARRVAPRANVHSPEERPFYRVASRPRRHADRPNATIVDGNSERH
jgi:hypothetical protein